MKEIKPEPGSPAEETLKRFRPASNAENSAKRKRFTAGMFVVNIILITVLYLFHASKSPTEIYQTTSINFKDLQFRFSIIRDKKNESVNASLTTRPAPGKSAAAVFKNGIADLVISYGTTVILQKPLGKDITALSLKPDEVDIQNNSIDRYEIGIVADTHPEYVVASRSSFMQYQKPYIPLTAEVRIHVDPPISTSIPFTYEVDK